MSARYANHPAAAVSTPHARAVLYVLRFISVLRTVRSCLGFRSKAFFPEFRPHRNPKQVHRHSEEGHFHRLRNRGWAYPVDNQHVCSCCRYPSVTQPRPHDVLGGLSPIDAVTSGNLAAAARVAARCLDTCATQPPAKATPNGHCSHMRQTTLDVSGAIPRG